MGRRRISLTDALLATLAVAVACAKAEDSDLVGQGTPATGGSAGSASAGAAGKGAMGGTAGTASAGRGGSAGSSPAGRGGTGGSAGTGGSKSSGGSGGKASALGCELPSEGGAPAGGAAGESGGGGASGEGPGSGSVLFFDDFESGNASRWSASAGSWSVVTDGSEVYEQSLEDNEPQFSMVEDSCYGDQIVEARVKVLDFPGSSTSYHVALFARALGPNTHYFVAFDSTGKLSLRKRVNASGNASTRLGSDKALSPRLDDGAWHTLRLEVVGTTLTAFVDGNEELSATDASIASGGVAVGTLNGTAQFDDVRVTAP